VQLAIGTTFINAGGVNGGNGGYGGGAAYYAGNSNFGYNGQGGAGGDGISGAGVTVVNSGYISGGIAGGPGTAYAQPPEDPARPNGNAITFTGGTNRLELWAGSTISGNVVANGTMDTLTLGGALDGTFNVTLIGDAAQYQGFERFGKTGSSTWTITGTAVVVTNWTISGGSMQVDGDLSFGTSSFDVASGGTMSGTGTVGTVVLGKDGVLATGDSGAGVLHTGNVSLLSSSSFAIELGGTSVGTQYDQLSVTGSVQLGGTLAVTLINGYAPTLGTSFTIIDNDGSDGVTGALSGLSEGDTLDIGNLHFAISYRGGTGNDVTLTTVANSVHFIQTGGSSGASPSASSSASDGNDTLTAPFTGGTVSGLGGDDLITGSEFSDVLFGNQGGDTINGAGGDDTIVGGNDSLDGADLLFGGAGNDLMLGNGGNDTMLGGDGTDTMVGGYGTDILYGNQGNDLILGNQGNDIVFGGFGNDTVYGGLGDDILYGNEGNDLLFGNEGADRYVFGTNSGADIVGGFSFTEGDRLDLQGQTFTVGTAADGSLLLALSGGGSINLIGVTTFQPGFVV
jgi:hypothetical protein